MTEGVRILLGGNGEQQILLDARMGNRHGLIAGATGTGKTVSLQVLAEGFSRIGVPVFLADVKGDLSGLAKPAAPNEKIRGRVEKIGILDYSPTAQPVVFWDLLGEAGHPIRTTISEIGPLLLSSLLELNEVQEGVIYACFRLADKNGLLLLDLKDLRAMLSWMAENAEEISREYGNVSTASVGAIQRRLMVLEEQGADRFIGEPAIKLADLMRTDFSGRGVVSVLDVRKLLQQSPRVYATFLLWLLSELFEELPEVGDPERPKLVFFFDEAHLLFDRAPRPLLEKIEQVARLIRSKGVGVYFITQNPADIPDEILGQLGLRIQHALRAFTAKDQQSIKAAAGTFRPNPAFATEQVMTELATGEALVSVLDERGQPTVVERVLICPPASRLGAISDDERREHLARSPLAGTYDQAVDRESAYESLKARTMEEARTAAAERAIPPSRPAPRGSQRQSVGEAFIKSTVRTIGNQIGREIIRGVLGSILRRR